MNLDDRVWGPGPLWNLRDIATESGVVHLVDENAEESSGLFVWVRLELGVDLEDEGGSDGGEKTSLRSGSASMHMQAAWGTHKYQGRVQLLVVPLRKFLVIPFSHLPITFIESSAVSHIGTA